MNLRKFIRELLEARLSEAMVTLEQIDSNVGLFIHRGNNSIHFSLYDPIKDKIYGTLSINKLRSSNYAVAGVAAEYGYGSFMYELAMTYIFPKALMPTRDGDVRTNAINIWNRFLRRDDVKKEHIEEGDADFPWAYYEDMGDDGDDPEVAFMYTRYFYNGAHRALGVLLDRGEKYVNDGVVDILDVDNKSSDFFSGKYD